jgi:hypothetical protein
LAANGTPSAPKGKGAKIKRRRKARTYETTLNGKKTQVNVPKDSRDAETLFEALKNGRSPQAVRPPAKPAVGLRSGGSARR